MKTIELDGVKYELVPIETKPEEVSKFNFYYGCESVCGKIKFDILLDEDGKIWDDTQTLILSTGVGTGGVVIWDNSTFLKNILDHPKDLDVLAVKLETDGKIWNEIVNLLKQVRTKGWI